jgi:hypothetical protein
MLEVGRGRLEEHMAFTRVRVISNCSPRPMHCDSGVSAQAVPASEPWRRVDNWNCHNIPLSQGDHSLRSSEAETP